MLIGLIVGLCFLVASWALYKKTKDFLHPAVVFSAIWGFVLSAISLGEPYGYLQISPETLLIFIFGLFSFIAGSFFTVGKLRYSTVASPFELDFNRIFWFCLLLHFVMLPLSWVEVMRIAGGTDDIYATAYRLRATSVTGEETVGFAVGNYLTAALFFIPVLVIGLMQKKIRVYRFLVLSIPWVALNIIIGGRSALVILIFTSVYVYFSSGRSVSVRAISLFLIVLLTILVVGNLLVGKIDAGVSDGVWSVFSQTISAFFDYLLQGPILFSQYIESPVKINPSWDALIFPCQILAKVGACKLPLLHQDFLALKRDGSVGNVYSIFFSIFPKYGFIGLPLIMWVYGFWFAFHHARRYTSIFQLLIAGFLFSACLLSVFLDSFGPSIYFFIKIFLFSWLASYAFKSSKNRRPDPRS